MTKIGSAFTEGTTLEPVNLVQQEGGSHNNHPADVNETAVRNGALQVIAMRRDAAGPEPWPSHFGAVVLPGVCHSVFAAQI